MEQSQTLSLEKEQLQSELASLKQQNAVLKRVESERDELRAEVNALKKKIETQKERYQNKVNELLEEQRKQFDEAIGEFQNEFLEMRDELETLKKERAASRGDVDSDADTIVHSRHNSLLTTVSSAFTAFAGRLSDDDDENDHSFDSIREDGERMNHIRNASSATCISSASTVVGGASHMEDMLSMLTQVRQELMKQANIVDLAFLKDDITINKDCDGDCGRTKEQLSVEEEMRRSEGLRRLVFEYLDIPSVYLLACEEDNFCIEDMRDASDEELAEIIDEEDLREKLTSFLRSDEYVSMVEEFEKNNKDSSIEKRYSLENIRRFSVNTRNLSLGAKALFANNAVQQLYDVFFDLAIPRDEADRVVSMSVSLADIVRLSASDLAVLISDIRYRYRLESFMCEALMSTIGIRDRQAENEEDADRSLLSSGLPSIEEQDEQDNESTTTSAVDDEDDDDDDDDTPLATPIRVSPVESASKEESALVPCTPQAQIKMGAEEYRDSPHPNAGMVQEQLVYTALCTLDRVISGCTSPVSEVQQKEMTTSGTQTEPEEEKIVEVASVPAPIETNEFSCQVEEEAPTMTEIGTQMEIAASTHMCVQTENVEVCVFATQTDPVELCVQHQPSMTIEEIVDEVEEEEEEEVEEVVETKEETKYDSLSSLVPQSMMDGLSAPLDDATLERLQRISQICKKQYSSALQLVMSSKFRSPAGRTTMSAAAWIPDAMATNCMMCVRSFTLTRRRHHCRLCGYLFCSSCCWKKGDLSEFAILNISGSPDNARVCDSCCIVVNAVKPHSGH